MLQTVNHHSCGLGDCGQTPRLGFAATGNTLPTVNWTAIIGGAVAAYAAFRLFRRGQKKARSKRAVRRLKYAD